MQFTGKKTQRIRLPEQLCVTEEMALEIHRRADLGFRSREDQIRFLILQGMMREDEQSSNEQSRNSARRKSLLVTGGSR